MKYFPPRIPQTHLEPGGWGFSRRFVVVRALSTSHGLCALHLIRYRSRRLTPQYTIFQSIHSFTHISQIDGKSSQDPVPQDREFLLSSGKGNGD